MLISTPFVTRYTVLCAAMAVTLAVATACGANALAQVPGGASSQPPAASAKGVSPTPPAQGSVVPLSTQGGSTLRDLSKDYQPSKPKPKPKRTITAHVVALDQPFMWNRLGASQPNGMVYALARDIVPNDYDPKNPVPFTFADLQPGGVVLREDKRPRPLVLRVNEGDELVVIFTNLLKPTVPAGTTSTPTRYAGFHVMGLELFDSIASDSSWVGTNPFVVPSATQKSYQTPINNPGGEPGSLCAPGATKVYKYYAKAEGTYLVHSLSADSPGAADPPASQVSQLQSGLFGVVNVQPEGAEYYRSQVLADDLGKATYYIWETELKPLEARRLNLARIQSLAERREEAKREIIYLPKQSGVYYLYEPRLMSWGDGTGVPTSGNNLVIVGADNGGMLHIRIFDAAGTFTDTVETNPNLPAAAFAAIAALKQQLPGLLPPHVLTGNEKDQVIGEVASIVGKNQFTNMHLAVELNATGNPAEAEIDGFKHPVYTLTTVVPAPENQVQKRTFKTTSVVLLTRKGDPAGMLRLYLASGQQLVNYVAIYPRDTTYPSGQPIPPLMGTGRAVSAPVLSMLHPAPDPVHFPERRDFELAYSDLTAIITGPSHDRWPYSTNGPLFNENPSSPDRRQPYREFTIVYHYNFTAVQAFQQLNTESIGEYGWRLSSPSTTAAPGSGPRFCLTGWAWDRWAGKTQWT